MKDIHSLMQKIKEQRQQFSYFIKKRLGTDPSSQLSKKHKKHIQYLWRQIKKSNPRVPPPLAGPSPEYDLFEFVWKTDEGLCHIEICENKLEWYSRKNTQDAVRAKETLLPTNKKDLQHLIEAINILFSDFSKNDLID